MVNKDELRYCYHCGERGTLNRLESINNGSKENVGDEVDPFIVEYNDIIDVLCCEQCTNLTIYRSQYDEAEARQIQKHDPDINYAQAFGKLLYPNIEQEHKEHIPDNIYRSYLSSIKVQNIDMAFCLIGLRRTLEMICKDKGYTKGMLGNKLKAMSEDSIIPPIIDKIATGLKDEGNKAAHGDEVEFTKETVQNMIEFTRIILNYVYSLPGKIATAQKLIEKDIT